MQATKLENCIIINFLNSAVNLQVGKPIFNLKNEKLGDKQRHFVGDCCGEVGIVLGPGQSLWDIPKPDAHCAGTVVPVEFGK